MHAGLLTLLLSNMLLLLCFTVLLLSFRSCGWHAHERHGSQAVQHLCTCMRPSGGTGAARLLCASACRAGQERMGHAASGAHGGAPLSAPVARQLQQASCAHLGAGFIPRALLLCLTDVVF